MNKNKKPVFLIIALLLIVVSIISSSLVVTTYSRYISSDFDEQSSDIAKFSISEVLENGSSEHTINVSLKPGTSHTQNIIVTNNGEVDVTYTITVINTTNNLPLEFTTYTGIIKAGTTDQNCSVVISWDSSYNSPEYSGKTDIIKIMIQADQIVSE